MRFLFLLCFIPCIATGQSWNIIAQGGGVWNSKTSKPTMLEHGSPLSGIAAAGFSYRNKAWEAGLTGGYRRYAFTMEGDVFFEEDFNPLTGTYTMKATHFKSIDKWPAIAVAPFLKYHFGGGRLDYYLGIMPAYLNFGRASATDTFTGHTFKYGNTAQGFAIDALAGFGYQITPAFGLYAEGTGGAVNTQWFTERAWFYTASLSLGVRVCITGGLHQ